MSRLPYLLLGAVMGAALVFVPLKYHVVRSSQGIHVVPKVAPEFAESYVDIRDFSPRDWTHHPRLALAIERAGHGDLLVHAASASWREFVQGMAQSSSD